MEHLGEAVSTRAESETRVDLDTGGIPVSPDQVGEAGTLGPAPAQVSVGPLLSAPLPKRIRVGEECRYPHSFQQLDVVGDLRPVVDRHAEHGPRPEQTVHADPSGRSLCGADPVESGGHQVA